LNKQKEGIGWTRLPRYDGSDKYRNGYTWNPVGGCIHDCYWRMPGGKLAECYAKTITERFNLQPDFKEFAWHPERLKQPSKVKKPAGIFLDSMSDLMAHNVPDKYVSQVLDVCRQSPQHIFLLLTKNAPRLLNYDFPPNVWVGVSTPPDIMFGKSLSDKAKKAYLNKALDVLSEVVASIRWMSIEPLNGDYAWVLGDYGLPIDWVTIGAASYGTTIYAPDETYLRNLLVLMIGEKVPIFFKKNMTCSPLAERIWYRDFPTQHYLEHRLYHHKLITQNGVVKLCQA